MHKQGTRKKSLYSILLAAAVFFAVCFAVISYAVRPEFAPAPGSRLFISAVYTLIFVLALLATTLGADKLPPGAFAFFAVAVSLILLIRLPMLDIMSGDYGSFLSEWGAALKRTPGFSGLGESIGNYNVPYMAILWLISRLNTADLYLIKLVSAGFDVMLAYYGMKLLQLRTKKTLPCLLLFSSVLLLPTVLVNGAWWAQCDSIYAAFGLAGLYYGCTAKGVKSVVMFTLSFCFKLQGAFFFPLVPVFLVLRKIRLRHLAAAPITYLISILPAVLAGRSFWDVAAIYFKQADTYKSATLYCPNIYTLLSNVYSDKLMLAGIFISVLFVLLLVGTLISKREALDDKTLLLAALLLQFGLIILLPRMHERYSFVSDVLFVTMVFYDLKYLWCAVAAQLCSFMSYMVFLTGRSPVPLEYLAVVRIVIFVWLVFRLCEGIDIEILKKL